VETRLSGRMVIIIVPTLRLRRSSSPTATITTNMIDSLIENVAGIGTSHSGSIRILRLAMLADMMKIPS
jgi:hypothetical protein